MTLKDQFMEDPFFTSKLSKTSSSTSSSSSSSRMSGGNSKDSSWMSDRSLLDDSFPKLKDCHLLGLEEDAAKLEISLNTTGYKPEELMVNVSDDEVKVEGRHEERSQEGELMVTRHFCRCYTLPTGAKQENV